MEPETGRLVSVIIPALDAEDTIERCVSATLRQTWPALEVIVVDNGSRDATAKLAERSGARVVIEAQRGRSRARNRGVAESRGSVLGFIDADCEPPVDWVSRSVAAMREPWLCAAQARVQKSAHAPPGRGFVQAHFYWPFLDSCALMTTRSAFDRAGGFDEDLTRNEDMDFSFRLLASGVAFAWLADTIVKKKHGLSPFQALRRGWVSGQSLAVFARKWHPLMGVSQPRFAWALSKGVIKGIIRDLNQVPCSRGTGGLEALGRLLGSVKPGVGTRNVAPARPGVSSRLTNRLGNQRFPVVGPDETLLFDAGAQRLLRLSPEQSRELERYLDADATSPEHDARIIRELGLEPQSSEAR